MKKMVPVFIAALLLFVGLPFVAVSIFPDERGMILCALALLLFNPLFFLVTGLRSADKPKTGWPIPLICAVLFFVSARLIYGMGEWVYMAFYLALAYVAMAVGCLARQLKRKKQSKNG